jgi:hypothetical protein
MLSLKKDFSVFGDHMRQRAAAAEVRHSIIALADPATAFNEKSCVGHLNENELIAFCASRGIYRRARPLRFPSKRIIVFYTIHRCYGTWKTSII